MSFIAAIFFLASSMSLTMASGPIPAEDLIEKVNFEYASTDGSFRLECKHWIANASSGDLDVICGKGTKWVKNYSVHLRIREIPRENLTTFEILYWITDRNNKGPVPAFSSHSQLLTVENKTKIKEFSMNIGLENDYSQMWLHFKP